MRKERVALKNLVHIPAVRGQVGDVAAIETDDAGGGCLEAGDHAQERGLAAAGRPQERKKLARLHAKINAGDGGKIPELFVHTDEFNHLMDPPMGQGARSAE